MLRPLDIHNMEFSRTFKVTTPMRLMSFSPGGQYEELYQENKELKERLEVEADLGKQAYRNRMSGPDFSDKADSAGTEEDGRNELLMLWRLPKVTQKSCQRSGTESRTSAI